MAAKIGLEKGGQVCVFAYTAWSVKTQIRGFWGLSHETEVYAPGQKGV